MDKKIKPPQSARDTSAKVPRLTLNDVDATHMSSHYAVGVKLKSYDCRPYVALVSQEAHPG